MRYMLLLLLTCTALGLTGCSRDTPEAMLENYLYRLSNSLELEQPAPFSPPVRAGFPLKRERILATEEIREGLLDVLRLQECNLVLMIAERNSSLGKVYRPSLKLAYELRFFSALSQCRQRLANQESADQALLRRLDEIYQVKQQNLPLELWNGIFSSEAIEANFSRDRTPLPLRDDGTVAASQAALSQLVALTGHPPGWFESPDSAIPDLEPSYEILHKNASGTRVFSSLELMTHYLNTASSLINTRLAQRPLCYNQQASTQGKILRNVFFKFYIGDVQPYLALVHNQSAPWMKLNADLLSNFQQLNIQIPESMQAYYAKMISISAPEGLWQQYIRARDQHTQSWQRLLKQCGLMPTK
ncbi:DUF3080 family protein [Neptuniibacter halophilus]|uniref:DUF3080 family protein n=1 Tax=Neptuniibacter halophilus TaxID=651666 RepID=UPI002572C6D1|nr:DUF3080 family protein [Neptuniibacter halophilus]